MDDGRISQDNPGPMRAGQQIVDAFVAFPLLPNPTSSIDIVPLVF
jgi:hypothetical protein